MSPELRSSALLLPKWIISLTAYCMRERPGEALDVRRLLLVDITVQKSKTYSELEKRQSLPLSEVRYKRVKRDYTLLYQYPVQVIAVAGCCTRDHSPLRPTASWIISVTMGVKALIIWIILTSRWT